MEYILLRNHVSFSGPHGDASSLEADEALLLVYEYKGIRALKVVYQL